MICLIKLLGALVSLIAFAGYSENKGALVYSATPFSQRLWARTVAISAMAYRPYPVEKTR